MLEKALERARFDPEYVSRYKYNNIHHQIAKRLSYYRSNEENNSELLRIYQSCYE